MNVFWDWNGTLCDDVRLSLDAVNDMLARRGRSGITMEQYYSYMGTPISKFYEHLFDFSVEPMEGLSREFYSYYQANTNTLHLREGAEAVLKRLRDLG
ncbi:MAG: HAD family hydrolase, partial [Clostridia bacterium]|nr:HAD family hydrolase [Clostridia bacterium]